MGGDGSATLLLRVRENFGDRYAQAKAWSVPESDRYPDGVKYSFQYGELDGDTIVRYDNFPDHPGVARHHRHSRDGDVEAVDFDGLEALYRRFEAEVNRREHDRN